MVCNFMKEGHIEKIKSRGYWRVNFQPLVDVQKFGSLSSAKESVTRNSVRLRGWDYPHISIQNNDSSGFEPCEKYYQMWIDWTKYKELLRVYKSGQVLIYRGLREDWVKEDIGIFGASNLQIEPGTKLGVIGTVIYEVTEMFEFLSRLCRDGLYDEGVKVSVTLFGLEGRELWIEDNMRAPFIFPKKTGAKKVQYERTLSKEEAISDSKKLATGLIKEIFDVFEWVPTDEQIIKDQDNLLSGRI